MRSFRAIALIAMCALTPLAALGDTTGAVRGFIRCIDCQGRPPIAGVTVTISGPNGSWKATTDANGFYVIFGVSPGLYKIGVHDRSMLYLPQLLYSVHPLCVHAGDYRDVDLFLGHELMDPNPAGIRRAWRNMLSEPDFSQSADVYSIGDC